MIWFWGYLCGVVLTLIICGILDAQIAQSKDDARSFRIGFEPGLLLAVVWPAALTIGLVWLIANAVYCGTELIVCIIIGQLKKKRNKINDNNINVLAGNIGQL